MILKEKIELIFPNFSRAEFSELWRKSFDSELSMIYGKPMLSLFKFEEWFCEKFNCDIKKTLQENLEKVGFSEKSIELVKSLFF
jgi:hypothetical protein